MSTLSDHGLIKVSNGATNNQTEFSLPSLKVEGLHFYNVHIELNDKLNKDQITISKLNLDAGPIDELNPVPLKGKFNFHSKKNELAAASAFASTLVMNAELNDLSFKQFIMNTNLTAKAINENVIKTSLRVPDLNIKTKEEKITAKPLHLKIDDMKGEGRLTVSRFTRPIIRFGLQTDKLNLDRLIPETTKRSAQQAEQKLKPAQQQADDIPTVEELIGEKPVLVEDTGTAFFAPLAAFKDTDMQGTISADQLTVRNLLMTNVRVVLQARSGLVSALPTATLYEGVYDGNLQIQTKAQPALLSTKHVLRDVQIGPIIEALYGKDSMTGRANIQGQFFSSGATREEIARNMNGDGQFSVRDAEIRTLDIKQLILKENYEKLKFVQEKEQDKEVTVFNTMRGTIRVKSGIAYNNDFTAISRRVHLKGKGNADLNQQTLKYTVTAIPKKSLAFDFGGRRIELKNKLIRTHFTGPWSNIDIDNDLEQVLKAEFKQTELYKKKRAQQEKIKEEIKQEKGKLEEKYKDKLDEILSR
jgi:AsmA protein